MKPRIFSAARLSFPFATALVGLFNLTAQTASAINLYWDSNGTGTAGVGTGTGTWGTSAFWTTDSTGANIGSPVLTATTTASDDLFFSAGTDAGTFTIEATSPSLLANSLTFEEGTTTIRGNLGVLTLTTGNIQVNSGATAQIGNPTASSFKIAGTNGLTKTGGGTLQFASNALQSFTGGVNVLGGTLFINMGIRTTVNMFDPANALAIGGGGIVRVGGRNAAGFTSSQTFSGVTVLAGGGQLIATKTASGTATNVVFGSLTATATGGSLLAGVTPGGTVGVGMTTTSNKDATGIYGGRVVYSNGTADTGFDWATSATSSGPGTPNTLSNYAAYTAMPLSVGDSTINYSTSAGGTLAGALDVNTLKVVGSATALDLGANTLTVASGGLLSTGTTAQTISGTAGATRLTAGNGSGSYDLIVHQYNSGGLTIGAVIGNNGGNAVTLVKAGTANLTLTGVNTYTGATYVNGGTLEVQSSIATSSSIINNGALTFSTSDQSFGNAISGLGSLTKATPGTTLILTGNNTYIGSTTITGGTLQIGSGGATGSIASTTGVTNNGALVYNRSGAIAAGYDISGNGTLTKLGTGTLTLSGNNSYSGVTLVDGTGITGAVTLLAVASNNALGSTAGGTTLIGGGTTGTGSRLVLNDTITVTGETLTIQTGLFRSSFQTAGNATWAGNVVIDSNSGFGQIEANGVANFIIGANSTNTFQLNGGTTLLGTGTGTINSTISGNGTLGKTNAGTWILTAANTHTGNTTIGSAASAGVIRLANSLALQDSTLNITTTGSVSALTFDSSVVSNAFTLGGLSAIAAGNAKNIALINNASPTPTAIALSVGNNDQSTTYNGIMSGGGSLTKIGTGTLTLGGDNSYTGTTTISGGTLLINGNSSTATGAVAVNAGILGGIGTTGGAVTVAAMATLAPGASIESLVTGALTMQSTSIFAYEVADNSATGADLLASVGALSLTGVTLSLDLATIAALEGGGWSIGNKLTLISYLGADITSGFTGYADDTSYFFGANEWLFNYNDTVAGGNFGADAVAGGQDRFVTMTVVAIPEPRAALLGGLGLLALLRRRR